MANFITGHRGWGLQCSSAFYCSQPRRGAQIKCQIPKATGKHEVEITMPLSENTLLTPVTLISSRDGSTCLFCGAQKYLPGWNNVVSRYSCLFTLPVQTSSEYLYAVHNSLVTCISQFALLRPAQIQCLYWGECLKTSQVFSDGHFCLRKYLHGYLGVDKGKLRLPTMDYSYIAQKKWISNTFQKIGKNGFW